MTLLIETLVVLGLAGAAWRLLTARRVRRVAPVAESTLAGPQVGLAQVVGRRVRSVTNRPEDADRDRVIGTALGASIPGLFAAPVIGLALFVSMFSMGIMRLSVAAKREQRQIAADLSEVIDLLAVALLSGHNVSGAVAKVSRWIAGPVGAAFGRCDDRVSQGRSITDALEALSSELGHQARPLTAALIAHERHGAPISASLAQLSADHRADQRRQAEASARRLPVHMLAPLVSCVLPAFLLLTVFPVVAETLENLAVFGP